MFLHDPSLFPVSHPMSSILFLLPEECLSCTHHTHQIVSSFRLTWNAWSYWEISILPGNSLAYFQLSCHCFQQFCNTENISDGCAHTNTHIFITFDGCISLQREKQTQHVLHQYECLEKKICSIHAFFHFVNWGLMFGAWIQKHGGGEGYPSGNLLSMTWNNID